MGKQLQVQAPAKINLSLDIVGLREDGYHLMEMVMQSVSLSDTITIEETAEKGIFLSSNIPYIPNDQRNIAYKAATAFYNHTKIEYQGVSIQLHKRIPSGAGLGGGSADGAAVLVGLNELYQTKLSMDELIAIGQKVGADIPFCLVGGTCFVEGIGEKITPLHNMPSCYIVIAKPYKSINTKLAFTAYDNATDIHHPNTQALLQGIEQKDLAKISSEICNVFEQTIQLKEITKIKQTMKKYGVMNAMMTGSGSAVFGIFTDESQAYKCVGKLKRQRFFAYLTKPISHGVQCTPQTTD
ncbi:4-(cytidine 5'-diphospho)-2-C-methyl-D-erythritol kinase [Paludicola sp. MB14-C6]|uniref:4-(cytidine 5'-diphospho)-2-C-methyl-D-erythritol kinase n=1 Tax=Paludihabitans sp. MB14-C6 TaxID=3070656 RepID=UPI0027DCAA01|nr:4-(cytidine 5'-diphospho)-2-C-methyl-D-erythritol kinase [Paludicola sp. MB14-C6]WMJ22623.1 4-(cytidine 5'-diphospho)-2-C-methyl-D-erythritol kinase [Paludicola sp. MB14-C6]